MRSRLLDLDGSVNSQVELVRRCTPEVHDLRDWGPRVRMSCSHRSFRRFEEALAKALGERWPNVPAVTFYGSGDFHPVSLALVRRMTTRSIFFGRAKKS